MKSWRRISITCAVCKETVIRGNKGETCSIKCREILRRKRKVDAAPVGECPICGESTSLVVTANGAKVCSTRCRMVVWQRLDRRKGNRAAKDVQATFLGTQRPCVGCGDGMLVTRHDLRFCSAKCADRWNYRFGVKGANVKSKTLSARQQKNKEIGECALCKTSYKKMKSATELGMKRQNGSALFHSDHITPKQHGGGNEETNKRYLCWFCNSARMDMPSAFDSAIAAAGRAFWRALHPDVVNMNPIPALLGVAMTALLYDAHGKAQDIRYR